MSKKIVIAAGVASGLACLVPLTALAQAAAAAASRRGLGARQRDRARRHHGAEAQGRHPRRAAERVRAVRRATAGAADHDRRGPDAQHPQHLVLDAGRPGPGHGGDPRRQLAGRRGDGQRLPRRRLADHAQPVQPGHGRAALLRPAGRRGAARPARHAVRRELAGRHDQVHQQAAGPEVLLRLDARRRCRGTENGGVNYEAQGVLNLPARQATGSALRIGVEHGHDSGYIDQVDRPRGSEDRQGHQPRRLHRREGSR